MKLYADYIKEREDKDCKYSENCFIIYKIYDKMVSVIDIYSSKEARSTGEMLTMVNELFEEFKEKEVTQVFGFTDETTANWKNSDRLMKKFGFKFTHKDPNDENYNNYILIL